MKKVLVTGGSGFIAMHVIEQLWAKNYAVVTTVRSEERKKTMLEFAKQHQKNLKVVLADLCEDSGWQDATHGVDVVIHAASPFPDEPVNDEKILIEPALEGTKRVMQAASKNKVKRLVLVSSIAAVAFGRKDKKDFTNEDWSDIHGEGIDAYQKSKTLAERFAWDFIKQDEHKSLELVTINPGLVLGPILGTRVSSSNKIIQKMIRGEYPGCPNIQVAIVDVRDVAVVLTAAISSKNIVGQRLLLADKNYWIKDIAQILAKHGYDKVATRQLPDWIFWVLSLVDRKIKQVCIYLGMEKHYDCQPAKKLLHWRPTDGQKTILAAAKDIAKKT